MLQPKTTAPLALAALAQAEPVAIDSTRIKQDFLTSLWMMCGDLQRGPITSENAFMVAKNIMIVHCVLNRKVGSNIRTHNAATFEWLRTVSANFDYLSTELVELPEDLVGAIVTMVGTYDKMAADNRVTALELADAAIYVDGLLSAKYRRPESEAVLRPAATIELTTVEE